jgi:hypothetical protein
MIDMVPKAIMLNLVRYVQTLPSPLPPQTITPNDVLYVLYSNRVSTYSFTKDEMQKELLENMYRQSELDDLLKESDYTIRRRKECQQMVDSLGRASEIVSQVQ